MLSKPSDAISDITIKSLQSELLWIVLYGFVGLLLGSGALILTTTVAQTLAWLLASSVLYALVCQQTGIRLKLNRREQSSPLYADLGWANRLTIARGWLIAVTGGFLFIPSVLQQHSLLIWIAAAAYSFAAIFDRVDGFIARKTQRSSLLGAELDTVFDALGLLVAPLLALQLGKIHATYLLVSVAYYLFVLGIYVRHRQNKSVYPLAPSKLRRTLAGFQMAYVAVVLWPPFHPKITVLAGVGFMLPLLIGFLVDWFVVSGRINPHESRTANLFRTLNRLTNSLLLPAVRLALIPVSIYIATHSQWTVPIVATVAISVLLIVLGLAGRAGGMLLLMILAWTVPVAPDEPVMLLMVFGTIAIVLLGCGQFSVWQADDDWINRQDGA